MADVWTSGAWTVAAGREQEFIDAWREFAEWSAAAHLDDDGRGGPRAWLLRDREEPRRFLSVGPWPSDAAVDGWRADPGFRDRIGRIRQLLEGFEPHTLDEVVVVGG